MNAEPTISIVMPIYNAARYLYESIRSIREQTLTCFELICIDDGSTDESAAIVKEFARLDTRIKYVYQDNEGAGAARNRGIGLSKGDFLVFADADDLMAHDMLCKLHTLAVKEELDICACEANQFSSGAKKQSRKVRYKRHLLNRCVMMEECDSGLFQIVDGHPWGKLFRRELVMDNHLRFQNLRAYNDTYFVLVSYAHAKRIGFIGKPLLYYRVGTNQSIQDKRASYPTAMLEATDKIRQDLQSGNALSLQARRSLDEYSIQSSIIAFESIAYDKEGSLKAYKSAQEVYLPKWGLSQYKPSKIKSIKLRFKYWCLKRISFDQYIGIQSVTQRDGNVSTISKLVKGARLFKCVLFPTND